VRKAEWLILAENPPMERAANGLEETVPAGVPEELPHVGDADLTLRHRSPVRFVNVDASSGGRGQFHPALSHVADANVSRRPVPHDSGQADSVDYILERYKLRL